MIVAQIFSFIFWTSAVLGTQNRNSIERDVDQVHSKQSESELKTSANPRNIVHQIEEDMGIDGQKAPSDHFWQTALLNPGESMLLTFMTKSRNHKLTVNFFILFLFFVYLLWSFFKFTFSLRSAK